MRNTSMAPQSVFILGPSSCVLCQCRVLFVISFNCALRISFIYQSLFLFLISWIDLKELLSSDRVVAAKRKVGTQINKMDQEKVNSALGTLFDILEKINIRPVRDISDPFLSYRTSLLRKFAALAKAKLADTQFMMETIFDVLDPEDVEDQTPKEHAPASSLQDSGIENVAEEYWLDRPEACNSNQYVGERLINLQGLPPKWYNESLSDVFPLRLHQRTKFGNRIVNYLKTFNEIVINYLDQSDDDIAKRICEDTCHELTLPTEDELDVSSILNILAKVHRFRERWEDCKKVFDDARKLREDNFGTDELAVATILNNLAELFRKREMFTEAVPLLRQVLKIRIKMFGPVTSDIYFPSH